MFVFSDYYGVTVEFYCVQNQKLPAIFKERKERRKCHYLLTCYFLLGLQGPSFFHNEEEFHVVRNPKGYGT